MVLCMLMEDMNEKFKTEKQLIQQYILQKGLKKFGKKGYDVAIKETEQLHYQKCFTPIDVSKLSKSKWQKAQIILTYLDQKQDGNIKGRTVYNGKHTREWLSKQDSARSTVALESLMLTAVKDAHERHDMMTVNVPNTFI